MLLLFQILIRQILLFFYSQYCHTEFWFISLLMQLYILTPVFVFISFSIYLRLSTCSSPCLKRVCFVRYILILLPVLTLLYLVGGKYKLNMIDNSETLILTSNFKMGDYSVIYRGGISYMMGVILCIIKNLLINIFFYFFN